MNTVAPPAVVALGAPCIASALPDAKQRRAALIVSGLSIAAFLAAVPFAKVQWPSVWAFLPVYQSAYVMITLITAILLLAQFRMLRSRALLVLAGTYLFDALMASAHALSFPGLFAPTGLLGAGPQTTAWLYFLWHGGFPLGIIGYACLRDGRQDALPPAGQGNSAIIAMLGVVMGVVVALTLLATAGHDLLPPIMAGNLDASTKVTVATLTWLLSIVALAVLWRRRPHTLLDIWLMVVVCVWISDSALAAVFNHGRFDVGWYAGRVSGLLASSLILFMLLLENSTLYQELARLRLEERQRSGEQLQESEQRFRRLFDDAPLPLAYVGADGTILARNRRFVQVFGYTPAELPTIDDWWRRAYLDPGYRAEVQAAWNAAVARATASGMDIEPHEHHIACKDGSQRIMLVSGIPLPDGLLATFHDITERKQAERVQAELLEQQKQARQDVLRLNAELEQRVVERTAELSAANRELDSFAYAVSHDLRAPLRAMSGFSQALLEDYSDRLQGEGKTFLEQIDIASRRMDELIDGILVLSRSTRGELRRDSIDFSALATRQLEELARAEPQRQVVLKVAPGLVASGDTRMIEVVAANLLGNAWKYTARAVVSEIRVYAGTVGGQHGFCIADNGAGFDMAHAERLFKPFQRLHRQDEFPGIGIGLATVQRIVHRHGGEIVATSTPGKGATFCFTLSSGQSKEVSP